ncbi:Transmembrane Fragile-X-F-associated protein, partial [Aphelenchoides avenae]
MLTLSEITRWTGITPFEILIHTVAITVATVLLVFKWHAVLALTFWQVFAPLFVASALNCYFLFIIFIRAVVQEHQLKRPFMA